MTKRKNSFTVSQPVVAAKISSMLPKTIQYVSGSFILRGTL